MALTEGDKSEVRQIVREEIKQEINPLERKLDAMMTLLAPTFYVRHDVADLTHRVDRAEENISELQRAT